MLGNLIRGPAYCQSTLFFSGKKKQACVRPVPQQPDEKENGENQAEASILCGVQLHGLLESKR